MSGSVTSSAFAMEKRLHVIKFQIEIVKLLRRKVCRHEAHSFTHHYLSDKHSMLLLHTALGQILLTNFALKLISKIEKQNIQN